MAGLGLDLALAMPSGWAWTWPWPRPCLVAGLGEGHELVGDLVPADGHVDGPVHQVERGEHHWEDHSGKDLFICGTDI